MNLKDYLFIQPEIEAAVKAGKPVVALESTILSHGMPWPENLEFAHKVQQVVRAGGAVPATTAIIGNLSTGFLAATVATTMILASLAGIRIFATGGIGGVHRGAETTMDISADLQELAHTPVAVVCAGAKMILDIGLTLEYLETMGVPVLGMGTEDFPAFYCRKSGFGVDYAAKDELDAAKVLKAKWDLGLRGGVLIGNPVPEEYALDFDEMNAVIQRAIDSAKAEGVKGKHLTPYLLAHIVDFTEGRSLATNLQLAYNNARVASRLAVEYSKL